MYSYGQKPYHLIWSSAECYISQLQNCFLSNCTSCDLHPAAFLEAQLLLGLPKVCWSLTFTHIFRSHAEKEMGSGTRRASGGLQTLCHMLAVTRAVQAASGWAEHRVARQRGSGTGVSEARWYFCTWGCVCAENSIHNFGLVRFLSKNNRDVYFFLAKIAYK